MTNLKKSKINEILNEFNESKYFTIDDFIFEFPSSGRVLCKIKFVAHDDCHFILEEKSYQVKQKSTFVLADANYIDKEELFITVSPGDYKKEDCLKINDFHSVPFNIRNWIQRIDTELKEINNNFNIDNISELIKTELDKNIIDENERFTLEEIESMIIKLDRLEEKVIKLENEISKEDSEKIHLVIEDSKNNLTKYPKKSWYVTTWNKFKNLDSNLKLLIGFKDSLTNIIDWFK